ncbi:hypothetical protein NKH18_15805 [Streptomyces sp. M10(2022)]
MLNREIGLARATYAADALEAAGAIVVNSARATALCGTSGARPRHSSKPDSRRRGRPSG